MARNPHYLSQLAHIEIFSSDLETTVAFFKDIIGLDVTGRDDNSAYLRAWGDYFHHTLKVTQSDQKGMGHLSWRADSPEALADCVAHLEKTGAGIGWVDGDLGHGKAYRFRSPDGHIHEVFWDVVWLKEKGTSNASIYSDRYASNRRVGVNVRRFDHVTYMVSKGKYAEEKVFWQGFGLKNPDEVRIEDHIPPVGGLWTIGNLSHDIAVFTDPNIGPNEGVLNHIAYNLDSREEVLLGIDYILEKGHKSVMGAPTRHKADEGFFVYVMIPATGVLFEFYAGARLIFAPDHGPDVHYLRDNPNDAWGSVNPFAEMAKGKKLGLSEDGTVKPHDV
jgi:catechol 2,3-dioxygenase